MQDVLVAAPYEPFDQRRHDEVRRFVKPYTSGIGVFTPDSSATGSPIPVLNAAPDLLDRVLDMGGLLRQLSICTSGTAAAPLVIIPIAVAAAAHEIVVSRRLVLVSVTVASGRDTNQLDGDGSGRPPL